MDTILFSYNTLLRKVFFASLSALCLAAYTTSASNHVPTVGFANDISVAKNTPTDMSYSELMTLTGAADSDGDQISFLISAVENGSVTVNGSPVAVGQTLVGKNDLLQWSPPTNSYNTFVEAFQIKAFDQQSYSDAATQIGASIRGNNPPELTFVESLTRQNLRNAHKNEALNLTFDTLKTLSDLRDMDDDTVSFALDAVTSGTLFLDGKPIAKGAIVSATNILTWVPSTNAVGLVTAFKVVGFDGTDFSATPVSVSIEVTDPTPHFVKGANQQVLRGDFGQWIANWATMIGPDEFALHFEVTNDNPSLFLSEPEIADDGTLTYIVAPSAFGLANVTVVLADDQGHHTLPQTFTITASFVNYAPDFEIPGTLTLSEDAGSQKFVGFANNITAGEGESFQTLSFSVAVTNTALYLTKPTITADGTLSFKAATNAYGDDFVTVTLKDNGSTANGGQNSTVKTFILRVVPINDPPTISLKSVTLNEDSTASADLGLKDCDSPEANLSAKIESFSTDMIGTAEIVKVNSSFLLKVTPLADAFGKAVVTVSVSDNESSQTYPIAVTINPINDAPQFELARDLVTITAAGQSTTIQNFAVQISPGAANETNQTVTFDTTSSDLAFFASKPVISKDGTLKFKVADSVVGSNLVTVVARDSGGTLNGGLNTSAAKSFYIYAPENPFPELKGIYSGLFFESTEIKHTSSGSISATVTDKGNYSGKLQIGGGSYNFAGQFSLSCQSSMTVLRPGKTPLRMTLTLSADGLTGSISDGDWFANVFADQAVYSVTNSAPQAGKYTMTLDAADTHAGVATLTVNAAGAVSGVINMADGAVFNFSSLVTKRGQFPIYTSLYTGTGSALGWITFTNAIGGDLQGQLSRIRVSTTGSVGFTNHLNVLGSSYAAPVSQSLLNTTSGHAVFSSGALAADLSIPVTISPNNLFSCLGCTLVLKLNLQTGLITGTFVHPLTKSTATVKGVALQKANTFSGYFFSRDGVGIFDLK